MEPNISEQLANAVELAAPGTVSVYGRRRRPGSGTVWSVTGDASVIVTASHVVEREEQVAVDIDGEAVAATLLGRDISRDIAILQVAGHQLAPVEKRQADARVGTLVLALGHTFPRQISASFGVVNRVGALWSRRFPTAAVIHADVTMLPGFSGGPLIDASGAVLGVNTSGLTRDQRGVTIPAAQIDRIAADIAQYGHVRNGWIGITSQAVGIPEPAREAVNGQETGLLIVEIAPESPAASGGLYVGDILVALGDHPVGDTSDLLQLLGGDRIGQPLNVQVLRGGVSQILEVTPTDRPERRRSR
jgi:S1-C subfamily serine protease